MLLYKLLGKGSLNMTEYLLRFGPADQRPPAKAIFAAYGAPPAPRHVLEFFGERTWVAMLDMARRAASANLAGEQVGHYAPWWRIMDAAEEDNLHAALVWLNCSSWGKNSQLAPADPQEYGFWYPCIVTEPDGEGFCAFQCSKSFLKCSNRRIRISRINITRGLSRKTLGGFRRTGKHIA